MCPRQSRGVTLVELIVFIVIVGVAMAGLFAAFNTITAASADPQVRKQVLAIAESLMEEVQLMPFTFCDPDDPHVSTAQSAQVDPLDPLKCSSAAQVENIGPEGETRYDASKPFDNVNDYMGFTMNPILDITGTAIGLRLGVSASATGATVTVAV